MTQGQQTKSKLNQLGVANRNPMGEYIGEPLTQLQISMPSPAHYSVKLPPSGFQYSILGRHSNQSDVAIGPGPNKYDTRAVKLPFDESPHWSLGQKLKEIRSKLDTPAPSHYQENLNFRTTKSFTMSGRFYRDEEVTPGPKYLPNSEFGPTGREAKYSFGHRTFHSEEETPGPLSYNVPRSKPNQTNGPCFTMRRRLKETKKDEFPAPNSYYPLAPEATKMASLKGMHKEIKVSKTPGPANYIMPTDLFSGPHYTLNARNIPYSDTVIQSPGPSDYNPTINLSADTCPAFSLGSRPKEKKTVAETPGPQTYFNSSNSSNGGLKITLKGRYKVKTDVTPGPSDYYAEKPTSKMAHVKRLTKSAKRIEQSPGPSDYSINFKFVAKNAGPAYSLRKRLEKKTSMIF